MTAPRASLMAFAVPSAGRSSSGSPYISFVGIDIGKAHRHACAVDATGKVVFSKRLSNGQAEIEALIARPEKAATEVRWALDMTSDVAGLLLTLLLAAQARVVYAPERLVNRMAVADLQVLISRRADLMGDRVRGVNRHLGSAARGPRVSHLTTGHRRSGLTRLLKLPSGRLWPTPPCG